jgi:hypothetical protein
MRAFEVSLNGKKLCLAGIGDDGVLTAIVNWVTRGGKGDSFLRVGGLITTVSEHVAWVNHKPLRVGDQVKIRLVEKSVVDGPTAKHRVDPTKQIRYQKRYVRMMAKKLGWKIQTSGAGPAFLPKSPKTRVPHPSAFCALGWETHSR